MLVQEKIPRRERKAIKKLKHTTQYKIILWFFALFCTPAKKFIMLPFSAARKACWVISLSVYKILWWKIWYIDDFIIHKKLRGKWVWMQLFSRTELEAQQEDCDYLLLFSREDRKASHKFYKKAWLTIIGLWVGILAYKKLSNKK